MQLVGCRDLGQLAAFIQQRVYLRGTWWPTIHFADRVADRDQ
jgi:hypothetical protein